MLWLVNKPPVGFENIKRKCEMKQLAKLTASLAEHFHFAFEVLFLSMKEQRSATVLS